MRKILVLMSIIALSSCSTVKAAKKTGVEPRAVAECETVVCYQALPTMELIEKSSAGDDTRYRMRFQRRQGSAIRALGYGAAAVFTLGVSEVVTTPAEGAIQNDKMFIVEAFCDDDEFCHSAVMLQPGADPELLRGDPKFFSDGSVDTETVINERGDDHS